MNKRRRWKAKARRYQQHLRHLSPTMRVIHQVAEGVNVPVRSLITIPANTFKPGQKVRITVKGTLR